MKSEPQPEFLTREIIDVIHEDQIETRGGLHGLRDENALESAIAAARNVYLYGGGDPYEIAAAYAYHIAESQAYLDGNKRTGAQAALIFMEGYGIDGPFRFGCVLSIHAQPGNGLRNLSVKTGRAIASV